MDKINGSKTMNELLNKVENISQLMNPENVKKFRIQQADRIHKRDKKEAFKEKALATLKSFKLEKTEPLFKNDFK